MPLQPNLMIERRQDCIKSFNNIHYDTVSGHRVVKLLSGDYYVSIDGNEVLATILGSCVAACVRDPVLGIGGMNHFLLPGGEGECWQLNGESTRYGTFAMESLINGILRAGGQKERLEVKVFGGGNVIRNSSRIGSKNAAFVREYLHSEGLRILSEDLEGDLPRRIHFFPATGRVMMRKLYRKEDLSVVEAETKYHATLLAKPVEGEIDLF